MWKSILVQRTIPLTISYLLLILAAIALDSLLHALNLVWIGRYLGIAGTLSLAFSFIYSVRKKKLITNGPMKFFLKLHCHSGWIGTLMILVHSGVHFNAIIPWAATTLMMIVTASGHVGQHLLKKVKEEVKAKMQQLGINGDVDENIEQRKYWDTLTVKTLEKWRTVHMPMVSFLIALTLTHILTIFFFWNWR
ncbi:hypothetical protein G9409_00255 [Chlorobium sp. BLA1]|uniref:hypothetical protein n=1 Tax=Candidatus Chlorobium masyuteum TaxID=2716876 RepID=UPI00142116D1|nr:hypothetical protein [Candidatus Chlorobium masyuteum]NHQ59032.1 hypothetical protein [Candidatus Chlorobium masyuteum]NTU44358.1 hypothetical protein [Chlorobiaceae bacterium]